jgi:hypothetical protein
VVESRVKREESVVSRLRSNHQTSPLLLAACAPPRAPPPSSDRCSSLGLTISFLVMSTTENEELVLASGTGYFSEDFQALPQVVDILLTRSQKSAGVLQVSRYINILCDIKTPLYHVNWCYAKII